MTDTPAILVVDDDADIRCNVKDILDDLGYRADTAHDGPSALHMVENHSYDVVLLDFKMPGMDGAVLYAEMKKLRPEIVAIMVTAYAGSDGVAKAKAAGTWKVLRKPVDFAALLPLVDQAASEQVVLLVDDDHDFCENIWQLLRDQNFRVRIARTEADGILQAKNSRCEMAIVDLQLEAGGDGRNVIQQIRALNSNTKIILATGSNDDLDSVGADLVLRKPIDVKRMIAELTGRDGPESKSN